MKMFTQYINEQNKINNWLDSVKKMYNWYCENYDGFYDKNHFYSDKNHKKCDLINGKETIADCSGFVGACLCLAGYTNQPNLFNVRLGSFNHYKNSNTEKLSKPDKNQKQNILYISDINAFKCHKISDETKQKLDYSEIKAGDIIVKGSHVTIAADDGAKHLWDWGESIKNQHIKDKPIHFYIPKDKTITYPYRSYWRLK